MATTTAMSIQHVVMTCNQNCVMGELQLFAFETLSFDSAFFRFLNVFHLHKNVSVLYLHRQLLLSTKQALEALEENKGTIKRTGCQVNYFSFAYNQHLIFVQVFICDNTPSYSLKERNKMTCSYDQTHGSIDRVSTIPFHRQYLITAKLVFRTFKKYTIHNQNAFFFSDVSMIDH